MTHFLDDIPNNFLSNIHQSSKLINQSAASSNFLRTVAEASYRAHWCQGQVHHEIMTKWYQTKGHMCFCSGYKMDWVWFAVVTQSTTHIRRRTSQVRILVHQQRSSGQEVPISHYPIGWVNYRIPFWPCAADSGEILILKRKTPTSEMNELIKSGTNISKFFLKVEKR